MTLFKPASRQQKKLKLALTGPSGSGKTYSALLLASGLGKRIAVLDTENASASMYSDRFRFQYDALVMTPPYEIKKYILALDAAAAEGYDVLIVDSLTHAWAGEGGLLEKKQALDSRGGNSFTNWSSISKEQEELKSKILHANLHVVVTMRSKQEYVLETNDKGRSVPKKVGMAPIQRDGTEYDYDAVFDIGMDHSYLVSKDRTGLFDGEVQKITEKTGQRLLEWLQGSQSTQPKIATETTAKPVNAPLTVDMSEELPKFAVPATAVGEILNDQGSPIPYTKKLTPRTTPLADERLKETFESVDTKDLVRLRDWGKKNGMSVDDISKVIKQRTGKDQWGQMTVFELDQVSKTLELKTKRSDHANL